MALMEWPGEKPGDIVLRMDQPVWSHVIMALVLLAVPIGLSLSPARDIMKSAGWLIYLVCAGAAPFLCFETVLALVRQRRVVITDESILLLDFSHTLKGQIPFENIASMDSISDYAHGMHTAYIYIADVDDEETWWHSKYSDDDSTFLIHIDRPAKFVGAVDRRR